MFQDQGPIRLCRAPVGERVWAMGLPGDLLANYLVLPANASYHLPTNTDTLL
jgi:hypothetical protein